MTNTAGIEPATRVGLDVGGTNIVGVTLDRNGDIVEQMQRPTPRGVGSLDALVDALVELAEALGFTGSLGVGVPGLVSRTGVLRAAPNLDGVSDFDIRGLLAQRVGSDVAVDNDATCAAVAEWQLGAARGIDNLILITLGTGIGGGIIANGSLVRGHNRFAGEFGHMVVDPSGPACPCGKRGCWERYASGSGLAMFARRAAAEGHFENVLERAGGDAEAIRGEDVQNAAREGDADAAAVIDEFSWWVALGLSNLTNAFDPGMFVLGGGLASGADVYCEPIRRWYAELLYQPELRTLAPVEFAELGTIAGAVGAALLPGLD